MVYLIQTMMNKKGAVKKAQTTQNYINKGTFIGLNCPKLYGQYKKDLYGRKN